MDINKIAVIGGGTMGNGIAHVFSMNGFEVNLVEMKKELAEKALATISKNLDRQIKKEKISEDDKKSILSRINTIVGVENTPFDVDLVIEAIFENKDVKASIFNTLQPLIKSDSIFASNTSSISITELSVSNRPDKFIGMHFMNPVPMLKLIEIIRGYSTSDETFNTIKDISEKIGKEPVEVFDYPGFLANRILMPMIN